MQIDYLHNNVYRLYRYARPQENLDYHRQLYEPFVLKWQRLKKEKVDDKVIAQVLGISRATYYRYKAKLSDLAKGIIPPTTKPHTFKKSQVSQDLKDLVLQIRRENPTYGKAKIAVIIERDYGMYTSESTVGRVLKYFMNKGLVTKSRSAVRAKRKRVFKKHARRWKYTMKPQKQGEMIQIDHMTVTKNSVTLKHFQAWDPRVILAEVYRNATSRTPKRFLSKVIDELPFPVKSIQVDEGSEFIWTFLLNSFTYNEDR